MKRLLRVVFYSAVAGVVFTATFAMTGNYILSRSKSHEPARVMMIHPRPERSPIKPPEAYPVAVLLQKNKKISVAFPRKTALILIPCSNLNGQCDNPVAIIEDGPLPEGFALHCHLTICRAVSTWQEKWSAYQGMILFAFNPKEEKIDIIDMTGTTMPVFPLNDP